MSAITSSGIACILAARFSIVRPSMILNSTLPRPTSSFRMCSRTFWATALMDGPDAVAANHPDHYWGYGRVVGRLALLPQPLHPGELLGHHHSEVLLRSLYGSVVTQLVIPLLVVSSELLEGVTLILTSSHQGTRDYRGEGGFQTRRYGLVIHCVHSAKWYQSGAIVARTSPLRTVDPTAAGRLLTTPDTGDGMEFSIFMASSTTTVSPTVTGCPISTA